MINIFVGHVGAHCTEVQIRSIFEAYGRVNDVSLTGDSAIIQMPDDSEADEAIRDLGDAALFQTPLVSTSARELMWSKFHSH